MGKLPLTNPDFGLTDSSVLSDARAGEVIFDLIARSRKAQSNIRQGSAQFSLLQHRIRALEIALILMNSNPMEEGHPVPYSPDDLDKAVAPIQSLISKISKAQGKLKPGTWQAKRLAEQLDALARVLLLLEKAQDSLAPPPES